METGWAPANCAEALLLVNVLRKYKELMGTSSDFPNLGSCIHLPTMSEEV